MNLLWKLPIRLAIPETDCGILKASEKSRDDLAKQLKGDIDSEHDFSVLTDVHIEHLVDFLKWGMIDMAEHIDYGTKKAIGADLAHGKQLFDSTCASCHGSDGKMINFGSEQEPEYLGDLANGNPWETLHKIRFGQPGTAMPAGVANGWDIADAVDVLGYAQTLSE